MKGHKVKIVAPFAVMGTRVWIDDMEMHKVSNVEFAHPVEQMPTVRLTFHPDSIEINGEMGLDKISKYRTVKDQIIVSGLAMQLHDGQITLTQAGFDVLASKAQELEDEL